MSRKGKPILVSLCGFILKNAATSTRFADGPVYRSSEVQDEARTEAEDLRVQSPCRSLIANRGRWRQVRGGEARDDALCFAWGYG